MVCAIRDLTELDSRAYNILPRAYLGVVVSRRAMYYGGQNYYGDPNYGYGDQNYGYGDQNYGNQNYGNQNYGWTPVYYPEYYGAAEQYNMGPPVFEDRHVGPPPTPNVAHQSPYSRTPSQLSQAEPEDKAQSEEKSGHSLDALVLDDYQRYHVWLMFSYLQNTGKLWISNIPVAATKQSFEHSFKEKVSAADSLQSTTLFEHTIIL
jgi:hypothetical protein